MHTGITECRREQYPGPTGHCASTSRGAEEEVTVTAHARAAVETLPPDRHGNDARG
nr:hypothetical protein StreXyl84_68520 [Streptomyces sp. Xyl84]